MRVSVRKSILSANDEQAERNKARFKASQLMVINVMASPGAGKTSLIMRLLENIPSELSRGVIEGDVASSIDADRIAAVGVPVTQINTGGACHLDAFMVDRAMDDLKLSGPGYLFIENIGNLICPTDFRLGETVNMVVASVPEGDDKPIKYPAIFAQADIIILNKIDLLPLIDFNLQAFSAAVRAVNEEAPIINISCTTGEGIDTAVRWLREKSMGSGVYI
ncbi:MAG: hydrogenase nickel incorporation protein HypB [bacterium]|nr:hydrogenase nickel incorporation protein HypB [bacterium]MDD4152855.1 hydrogenase nickel incorporation protein HypB [bacterium]